MHDTPAPLVTIAHGDLRVDIAPFHGGRLAQITSDRTRLLVEPDDVPGPAGPLAWGSYPMVPWAGRIRDGRLAFGGRVVDLPRTLGQHAIHGVGFTSEWDVDSADERSAGLTLALPCDSRWPFGGSARQHISVDGDGVLLELTVTAHTHAFPASIGWHPWFRKPASIEFTPTAMYRRDAAGITVDELIEVPPGPWDDCFVNDAPIRVTVDDVTVELTSGCTDWVVYDEPEHATCVEPQTAPPDAVNTRPTVVAPGTSLTAWYRIAPVH